MQARHGSQCCGSNSGEVKPEGKAERKSLTAGNRYKGSRCRARGRALVVAERASEMVSEQRQLPSLAARLTCRAGR